MVLNKRKKGFTLVELLAVVAIIGILSGLGIWAYSRYISKAKASYDENNRHTVLIAAKSYFQDNRDKLPKTIGERVKIDLNELKSKNYLKKDVVNSSNESCMKNSYVAVYKYDTNDYSYNVGLYCGASEVKDDTIEPDVSQFIFSNLEDVNRASFTATLNGSKDGNVEIASYSYNISIKVGDNDYTNVYNSDNISGNGKKSISLNKIKLSNFMDVTSYSSIKVSIFITNIYGGVVESIHEGYYDDTVKPLCGSVSGAPLDDNDWLNKSNIENKDKRVITVQCADGEGSGCLRQSFTKTWPNSDEVNVKSSKIVIKDNAGNEKECSVDVNIDTIAPSIKVYAVRNSNSNKISNDYSVADGDNSIVVNKYNGETNPWLNYGVRYIVHVEDNLYLDKYVWTLDGSDTVTSFNAANDAKKLENDFSIIVNNEGDHSGKLTIYDKAGNSTMISIKVKIDKTAPVLNTISLYKYKSKSDSSIGRVYTPGLNNWSNLYIISAINGQRVDPLSGWDHFSYSYKKSASSSYPRDTVDDNGYQKVAGDGTYSVRYKSCDKAGNCSDYVTVDNINIDTEEPTCTPSINVINGNSRYTNGSWVNAAGGGVVIYGKCSDSGSGCVKDLDPKKLTTSYNGKFGWSSSDKVYDKAGNSTKCEVQYDVRIDLKVPTCSTSIKTTNGKSYNGDWLKKGNGVVITGKCSDTGGSTCVGNAKMTITDTTNKKVAFSEDVYDKAGNKTACSGSYTVKIDNTIPKATCTLNSSNRKISASVSDYGESGSGSIKYKITTSKKVPSSGWSTSNGPGSSTCGGKTYYGYVKVTNKAGNYKKVKCSGSYKTEPCCSASHPYGCKWVTSCRNGKTAVFTSSSATTWAGTVSHTYNETTQTGSGDKLYVLGKSGLMTKVYAATAKEEYDTFPKNRIVWIYSNCIGGNNSVCPYSTCPG